MLTGDLRNHPGLTPPLLPWTPHPSTSCCPSLFPASREQEGVESTSEEGQLPQVVEELKDLQVAPGTRLAKFQLKVKGKAETEGGARPPTTRGQVVIMAWGLQGSSPWASRRS